MRRLIEVTNHLQLVLNNFNTPQPDVQPESHGQPPSNAHAMPKHLENLTTSVFQSLFPPISPQRTPLSSIRRVLLVNRNPPQSKSTLSLEQQPFVLHLRHFAITSRPVLPKPLSRNLRRLDRAKVHAKRKPYSSQSRDYDEDTLAVEARRKASKGALPDLGKMDDVADFLLEPGANGGYVSASESEGEGTEAEVDVLAEPEARTTWSRKEREEYRKRRETLDSQRAAAQREDEVNGKDSVDNGANDARNGRKSHPTSQRTQKRAIRLMELGPRMRLRLYKVEEGLCSGKVMWHESVTKSKAEEKQMDETWQGRNDEKERRRREQRANLESKRKAKEAQRGKNKTEGNVDGVLRTEEDEDGAFDELLSDADEWDDLDEQMEVDI